MTISQLHIQEFQNFFTGSLHNYGELIYNKGENKKGKVEGSYRTISNKLITIAEYKSHLEGEKGLGIIPVRENETCSFAVIDVDVYDEKLNMYIEAIERGNFPLVPFISKSGGLHIYSFFKEPVNTKKAIEMMRRFSFLLSIDILVKRKGKGRVEIFPKQVKVSAEEVGSYINLPYFSAKDAKAVAVHKGEKLSLTDALTYIKSRQSSYEEHSKFLKNIAFSDAPPCLQLLYFLNPFDGSSSRNNYLFSFGVYLKKKDEDFFDQTLLEINKSLKDPLSETEVERTIIKSLQRRDYVYKCNDNPCIDFCNKKECRNREFGVGTNEGYFSSVECGILYQYRTSQPYYEWEVRLQGQEEFKRLRFKTEEEIIRQDTFLKLCMRELYELPSKLKQNAWFSKVNQALKEISVIAIEVDDDTSPFMLLKSLIMEFLTGRALAETKDQILAKRVLFDATMDRYIFRVKDLTEFLYVSKNFRYFSPAELHGILREMNCSYTTMRTESRKQLRVAYFSKKDLELAEESSLFNPDFSEYSQEEDF